MQAFGLLKVAQQGLLLHLLPPEETPEDLAAADGAEEDGADGDAGTRRALEHTEVEVKPLHQRGLSTAQRQHARRLTYCAAWQGVFVLAPLHPHQDSRCFVQRP
jgi:hypothetical protein